MSMPAWLRELGVVWDWIDRRQVIRRIMTLGTFWLTCHTMLWFLEFAEHSPRGGVDVAAIIGAIGVPLAGLQGWMFTRYSGHQETKQ